VAAFSFEWRFSSANFVDQYALSIMRSLNYLYLSLWLYALNMNAQNNLLLGDFSLVPAKYDYAIPTIVFSAVNTTFITYNTIRIAGTDPRKSNAPFGIISGAIQTTYGIMNFREKENSAPVFTTINLTIGIATIFTSAVRMLKNDDDERRTTSLYLIPLYGRSKAVPGFCLSRRLGY
jgi:hypothetical protein